MDCGINSILLVTFEALIYKQKWEDDKWKVLLKILIC